MTGWVIVGATLFGDRAWACPEKQADGSCDDEAGERTGRAAQPEPDPSQCARRAELVGPGACSWTTEMVAQRVLEEGTPWSYVGRLIRSDNALASKVAAPYTIGPEANIHVIANEVLEAVDPAGRVEVVGRLLEVDGTTYFVATSVSVGRT